MVSRTVRDRLFGCLPTSNFSNFRLLIPTSKGTSTTELNRARPRFLRGEARRRRNGTRARVIYVQKNIKNYKKRKSIGVKEDIWAIIKAEAKRNGRTIEGELRKKYETI